MLFGSVSPQVGQPQPPQSAGRGIPEAEAASSTRATERAALELPSFCRSQMGRLLQSRAT